MKSIRTYLLFSLLAIITLVTFFSVLHGYQSSIAKAEQLFDERLQHLAEIIAITNQDREPRQEDSSAHSSSVFFEIWSSELDLLVYSHNAPMEFLTSTENKESFKNVNFNGYRWRSFTLYDQRLDRWIVTGERIDIRYGLAENIVTASIIPIVLAIPIAGFIIWWAIGLGLKPLKTLAIQLSNKEADDLSAVALNESPQELTQLVTTINALLRRLTSAFLREQRFSADAAHELRTPISALKVQIHNLQQKNKYDENELKPLAAGIERMAYVIEQILSLYRHSPEQGLVQKTKVDLCAIAQQVIAGNYESFSEKNQNISLNSESDFMLQANTFAIETLIHNLVMNASKYTHEQGDILLTIRNADSVIQLVVEDSGIGIPETELDRVFERFYRVAGDRHASGMLGCGLGLAIVKHIVDLHGAKIKLEQSVELGGLKVIIDFPRDEI
ncbi:MAG: sensor histidine kinase [Methylophaga sp.]|nr:sensor histidine kinase [Methylophaga sp.]